MDENLKLKISASPHVRSKDTTSDIMFDVVVALVPATAVGLYCFGWYAALLVAVCIGCCVGFEALYQHCMGKKVTVGDFSAVVTGLLLAMNLPPRLPVWMAVLGSAFAIIIVKQLFGGLGQNFMNPALGARCFLILAFSRYMTAFYYDGVSAATPLAMLKQGGPVNLRNMFLGFTAGTIGEASTAALLIGAVYLLIRRVISPKIPLFYIGTFALCIVIYALVKGFDVPEFLAAHLTGGGLMLGAWFMATDYVTSPITPAGKIIYAVFLGLMTFVLRIFGPAAEGVSYSIIIANLLVPLIERITEPKPFGAGADVKKEEKKADEKAEDAPAAEEKAPEEVQVKSLIDGKGIVVAICAISLITLIMGAILGTVYGITKDPIANVEQQAKADAYKEVFPEANTVLTMMDGGLSEAEAGIQMNAINSNLKNTGKFDNTRIDEINFAITGTDKDNPGNMLGFVVLVTNDKGYGGELQLAIGISSTGEITGISFLKINETAGLGMKANTDKFKQQFIGKQVGQFTYTKTGSTADSEIDALSGATITTSAVTEAVNAALYALGGGY